MNHPEALAREIRAEMARRRMTQSQLAQALEVTPRTVTRWLDGKHDIRLGLLERIAAELGVRPSELQARAESRGSAA